MMLNAHTLLLMMTVITATTAAKIPPSNSWKGSYVQDNSPKFLVINPDGEKPKWRKLILRMCKINGTVADCTSRGFSQVPQSLPSDVTFLDLSHNIITELKRNDLANYPNLEWLSLEHNQISKLHNGSFFNLTSLFYLNLKGNNLTMNGTFPATVFKPLVSLRILKINQNNPNLKKRGLFYPSEALSYLTQLTNLSMDGLPNMVFDSNFTKLRHLSSLSLTGTFHSHKYCRLGKLKNNTFSNLSQVRYLNLSHCHIIGHFMEAGVFKPLQHLISLDLSVNDLLHFGHLSKVLSVFNGSNLKYLGIKNIINPYSPGLQISNEVAKSLPRHLETLVAAGNNIEALDTQVLDLLPKTLTNLDMSNNRLFFGAYTQNLSKLESLKHLRLNGATTSYHLPTYYSDTDNASQTNLAYVKEFFLTKGLDTPIKFILPLPPHLQKVEIKTAGWSYSITEFHINPNNSLTTLILSGNNIQRLVGPVTGLSKLKWLDLSDCNINHISETFFQYFPNLETLLLNTNDFGQNILTEFGPQVFKWLGRLRLLDISNTNVQTVIDYNVFDGLNNLETLKIDHNALHNFKVKISHMIRLSFINFSYTQLAGLSRSIISELDAIADRPNHTLTIDFSQTPIHCYCANLFFLKWFVARTKMEVKTTSYKCVFLDNSEKNIPDFGNVYRQLEHECIPSFELFAYVLICTCIVFVIIVGAIFYRFRWKLRYLYYSAYLYYKKSGDQSTQQEEFEFDVFVSYDQEDHKFVMDTLTPKLQAFGLNVHIHDLHFQAGDFISSNIVNAIQVSRHMLVILTRGFLDSNWCKFEIQMANMESVHTGRQVMVFLLMETLSKKELGTELLYHIQNNTYIQYPDEEGETATQLFWEKLAADLKA